MGAGVLVRETDAVRRTVELVFGAHGFNVFWQCVRQARLLVGYAAIGCLRGLYACCAA